MSKQHSNDAITVVMGAVTSMGIGSFFLHALGAFILGLIGALAGWVFTQFIRPALEKLLSKRKAKKSQEKA